ncbi:MAG: phosphoribosylformylglycinamidine cyclo-ligase [Gemmatimonadota bacterium]|nr:phosphoribosylformylglycinamidine cyclo-ligase [Gemmatimonadota bacterium]
MSKAAERYKEAGVDLDAAERAKERISALVETTRTQAARGLVGGFGGMVRLPNDIPDPVLVMSTDGVGTKVLVAIKSGQHDTVGEDLVNHCVNDILVHGAKPIAFLDYLALASVKPEVVGDLVEGVARGCRNHEMTLAGGETAEMPDVYAPGHYDLAGTIVGVVSESKALHGDRVSEGDVLIAYESSGLHTNGYSLARKIFFQDMGLDVEDEVPELGTTVADALLSVHTSYYNAVYPVIDLLNGLAHITGGGLPGNLSRVLPDGLEAAVDAGSWEPPQVFLVMEDAGKVTRNEMYEVFNMGVGMVGIVSAASVDRVRSAASEAGVKSWILGEIRKGSGVRIS